MTRPTKVIFPLTGIGRKSAMGRRVEMMPVVDKPLIQYAIEEALSAGFTDMIFVTGPARRSADGRLDRGGELEVALEMRGKTELLEAMRAWVPSHANCVLIRQPEALGAAHAVLCAKPVVGEEAFAVVLANELLDGPACVLEEMAGQYESCRCCIVAAQSLADDEPTPNGVLRCAAQVDSPFQVARISDAVTPVDDCCTPLGVVGRYIFSPGSMRHLETLSMPRSGQARLIDAIAVLLRHETVLAYRIEGERHDCGSKLGYLKAMLAFGLAHPEIGGALARHVETVAKGITPCVESSALSPSGM